MNSDNTKPKKGNKFVDGHYKTKLQIPTEWKYEKLEGKSIETMWREELKLLKSQKVFQWLLMEQT